MALQIGDLAPKFTAKINGGKTRKLSDYSGKWLILFFYPKDNTSVCTKQACSFRDNLTVFQDAEADILGISPDSVESHESFIANQNLNYDLLSDENHKIADDYFAWGEKNMYGNKYMGVLRSTFLISPDGKIAFAWYRVKTTNHINAVLKKLKEVKGK